MLLFKLALFNMLGDLKLELLHSIFSFNLNIHVNYEIFFIAKFEICICMSLDNLRTVWPTWPICI